MRKIFLVVFLIVFTFGFTPVFAGGGDDTACPTRQCAPKRKPRTSTNRCCSSADWTARSEAKRANETNERQDGDIQYLQDKKADKTDVERLATAQGELKRSDEQQNVRLTQNEVAVAETKKDVGWLQTLLFALGVTALVLILAAALYFGLRGRGHAQPASQPAHVPAQYQPHQAVNVYCNCGHPGCAYMHHPAQPTQQVQPAPLAPTPQPVNVVQPVQTPAPAVMAQPQQPVQQPNRLPTIVRTEIREEFFFEPEPANTGMVQPVNSQPTPPTPPTPPTTPPANPNPPVNLDPPIPPDPNRPLGL